MGQNLIVARGPEPTWYVCSTELSEPILSTILEIPMVLSNGIWALSDFQWLGLQVYEWKKCGLQNRAGKLDRDIMTATS